MSNYLMWSIISGFLLPPVEAIIQQSRWTSTVRAICNFLCCCAVALGVVYWQAPKVDLHDWVRSALLVLVTAISIYKGLWQPTTIAPKIEAKTST